jgi:hypothetical protein
VPGNVTPPVPADLGAVIARCLEEGPGARFPDAARLHEALGACACAGRWTEEEADAWWQARGAEPG